MFIYLYLIYLFDSEFLYNVITKDRIIHIDEWVLGFCIRNRLIGVVAVYKIVDVAYLINVDVHDDGVHACISESVVLDLDKFIETVLVRRAPKDIEADDKDIKQYDARKHNVRVFSLGAIDRKTCDQ